MSRVLILTNFFSPERTGIGVTATDSARFVKELGHTVEVVTTIPYYPEWKVDPSYSGKIVTKDTFEDIPITRVWMYVPQKLSTLKRILHELSGGILMVMASLFKPADILFCMSPPLTLGFLSMLLAKLRRKKYWCYVLDIQPDAAIDLGMLKNPLVRKTSFLMEKWMYRGSDKIVVLSEGMARNIQGKGVSHSKIHIAPVAVDVAELTYGKADSLTFRKKANAIDSFLVLYSGNLGIKHNIEVIVEAAQLLEKQEDIHFAIVGDGAAKPTIQKLVQQKGLKNISMHPLCGREEFPDMLASVNLLLAPQRKEVTDIVVPSKLISYLCSGTPIIATADPDSESARILQGNKVGYVLPPEDAQTLASKILEVRDSPVESLALAKQGVAFVSEEFSNEHVRDKYYKPLFSSDS